MKNIRNEVSKVGGRFYTQNLMSNPMQVRETVDLTVAQLEKLVKIFVEEEREACAQLCEAKAIVKHTLDGVGIKVIIGRRFAAQIRERTT